MKRATGSVKEKSHQTVCQLALMSEENPIARNLDSLEENTCSLVVMWNAIYCL
jgi:hypothetical protein